MDWRIADINRQRVPLLILWHELLFWQDRRANPPAAPFDPWADVIRGRARLFAKERDAQDEIPF